MSLETGGGVAFTRSVHSMDIVHGVSSRDLQDPHFSGDGGEKLLQTFLACAMKSLAAGFADFGVANLA